MQITDSQQRLVTLVLPLKMELLTAYKCGEHAHVLSTERVLTRQGLCNILFSMQIVLYDLNIKVKVHMYIQIQAVHNFVNPR